MQIILIIIGIILIIYNYRSIKKGDSSKKEVSFDKILKDRNDNMDEYGIELGRLRKDIAESLTELQEEILEIKTKLNMTTENINISENKENEEIYEAEENEEDNIPHSYDEKNYEPISENEYLIKSDSDKEVISEIDFSNSVGSIELSKVEEIGRLLKEGATEDEICHTLSVSKGEILLVKELFKN